MKCLTKCLPCLFKQKTLDREPLLSTSQNSKSLKNLGQGSAYFQTAAPNETNYLSLTQSHTTEQQSLSSVKTGKNEEKLVSEDEGLAQKIKPLLKSHILSSREAPKDIIALFTHPSNLESEFTFFNSVYDGDSDITELFIKYSNQDINAFDPNGNTALHRACWGGGFENKDKSKYITCVKMLLEAGAAINNLGQNEFTPMHIAAQHGFFGILPLLLDWKANINAQDKEGKTPLHWAAQYRNVECVDSLLANSHIIKVNDLDKANKSALHWAAEFADLEKGVQVIKALLKAGARADLKDNQNKSPLDYAREKGLKQIIDLFIDSSLHGKNKKIFQKQRRKSF